MPPGIPVEMPGGSQVCVFSQLPTSTSPSTRACRPIGGLRLSSRCLPDISLFTELSAAKPRPCSFPLSVRQFLRLEVQSSACVSLSSCHIQSVTTSHHSTAERIPSIFLASFPLSFLISPPPRPHLFSTRCSCDLIKVHIRRCHSSS